MRSAVWNVAPAVAHKPCSLNEIMSEQLVESLAEPAVQPAPAPVAPAAPAPATAAMEDADLALALQLQQQFDRERFQLEQNRLAAHQPPFTKVVLDSDLLLSDGTRKHTDSFSDDSSDDDDGSDDDDDDDDDEEEEGDGVPAVAAVGRAAAISGSGAPAAASAPTWKTKHDAELTGARNTEYILDTHPEQDLGDLAGDLSGKSVRLSNPVFNSMMLHADRSQNRRVRKAFGSETQTRDQVIDQKTRLLLQKMINADVLTELNGAISTGKESVVFHGVCNETEYAVKIFKTTLNEFKNRQRYVEGEHRFRHAHKRQNPRRLIRLWAEKEMRNLKRIASCGIRCPEAVLLKKHILVLQFVGKDGQAAPKLRDAALSVEALRAAYVQCVVMMRRLYQECHLVHADLSAYNMLWYKGELWLIDLAQGVEQEHPNALPFLQRDCKSVSDFFRAGGVADALSVRQLFDFVTVARPAGASVEALLSAQMGECAARNDPTPDADDAVWFSSFIPRSLSDLADPQHSHSIDARDRFHDALMRLDSDSDSDDGNGDGDEGGNGNGGGSAIQPPVKAAAPADKAQRKAAKKASKVAQRERRKLRSAEKNAK